MTQKHIETQVVSKTFNKFVIIFISLLAGVNLYLMVDLFWYKGFEFKHWMLLFPFVVGILGLFL